MLTCMDALFQVRRSYKARDLQRYGNDSIWN